AGAGRRPHGLAVTGPKVPVLPPPDAVSRRWEAKTMTSSSDTTRPIVVGVDGSALADAAVLWAAAEADRRGTSLHVVPAFVHLHACGGELPQLETAAPLEIGGAVCVRAERQAREASHGLTDTTGVRVGRAAPELIKASREATTVVLGARGHGRVTGLLIGS